MNPNRHSLDRFLEARAGLILGRSTAQVNAKLQAVIGGSLLAIALGLAGGVLFGGPREMLFGAIGPGLAGVINISVGVAIWRHVVPSPVGQVEYSKEARDLIRTLWRKESPQPADDVIASLERAASAYQRLAAIGALGLNQAPLKKMGLRVAIAAEEAMADIFHQASTLVRYPEGGDVVRRSLEASIESLEEIALRLEELATQTAPALDVSRTSVDDLLTELRLEVLARAELRPTDLANRQSQKLR